jgi:3-dehydroquinate dehydratase-2
MKKIYVINGPNLNLLGTREPEVYGSQTLSKMNSNLKKEAKSQGIEIRFFQSNIEGELVDFIQKAGNEADAIIINPAGYTHTSVVILDALKAVSLPKVEVHLSNISAREHFRKISLTAQGCDGYISGLGSYGYQLALQYIADKLEKGKL